MHRFWRALESLPALSTSHAEWMELLGDGAAAALPLLQATGRIAGSVPVPGNSHARYRVVDLDDGTYFGVHDDSAQSVRLGRREVTCYEVNVQRLAGVLAELIGFEPAVELLEQPVFRFRLGTYGDISGYSFPIYLVKAWEADEMCGCLNSLLLSAHSPLIVMTPTPRKVSQQSLQLLENRGCLHLALSEALQIDSADDWSITPAARAKLLQFRDRHVPRAETATGTSFFPTPQGASWADVEIRFLDGETVSVSVGGSQAVHVYAQLGMADGRNARPNKQWELLRAFASGHGLLTWSTAGACRQNKKRKEYLSTALREFFRIDGDPFELTGDKKGWRAKFKLHGDL